MPKDNTARETKLMLRSSMLPEHPRILDLFCGNGVMYRALYEESADKYFGIDKTKIFNADLCAKANNEEWLMEHKIDDFNVFDIDAYSSPGKYYSLILSRLTVINEPLVFFSTDGALMSFKINTKLPREYHSSERICPDFQVPSLFNFYEDIHSTYIKHLELKFPVKVDEIKIAYNDTRTTAYWGFRLLPAQFQVMYQMHVLGELYR